LKIKVKNVQAIYLILKYIETKGTILSTHVLVRLASIWVFTYTLWCY